MFNPCGLIARDRSIRPADLLVSVFLGGSIYVLWRSPALLMFEWAQGIGLHDSVTAMRSIVGPPGPYWPNFLLNSLPGALWSYALVGWIAWCWRGSVVREARIWVIAAASAGPVSELLQGSTLLPGTFDAADLLAYTIASLLGMLSYQTGGRSVA